MRTISRLVVTAVSLGAVSGCSVYEDMTTSGFAKQDSDAIVLAASKAMQDVTSMRLTGDVRDEGTQVFVDLRVDRGDDCIGTLRFGASNVDVRRVGGQAWVKGESGALNRLTGSTLPRQVLEQLSRKWMPVDGKEVDELCDFEELLETFEVVDFGEQGDTSGKSDKEKRGQARDDLAAAVPATVVEESTMDGAKVVKLGGKPGGTHDEFTWVLSEAPHHVVKIESNDAQEGGILAFSEFNADVEVEAPSDEDVFRA